MKKKIVPSYGKQFLSCNLLIYLDSSTTVAYKIRIKFTYARTLGAFWNSVTS